MPKKNQWPVARTESNRVAVWFDLFSWPIVRDGILRKYLELRASEGELEARNEIRRVFPITWIHNQLLKRWELLDRTGTLFRTRPEEALKLYQAGWSARLGGAMQGVSPEKLVALGDKWQKEAYQKELVEIEREAPNADADYWQARHTSEAELARPKEAA